MRRARYLVQESMIGLYHVVSRVVDRRMVFQEEEKRHFLKLMKMYAAFSGLNVISWCFMDNHFDMLVAVPPKDTEEVPEKEVLRRMALVYGRKEMKEFASSWGIAAMRRAAANCWPRIANVWAIWGSL